MKFIHQTVKVKIGDQIIQLVDGLGQGSLISPLAFDLISETLIEKLVNSRGVPYFVRMYADDLVLICQKKSLDRILSILEEWSTASHMVINKKKSAILQLSTLESDAKSYRDYPYVSTYKYLGC